MQVADAIDTAILMADENFEAGKPKRPSIPRPSSAAAKEALKDRLVAPSKAPRRRLMPPNRKGVSYVQKLGVARPDKEIIKERSRQGEQLQQQQLRAEKDSIVSGSQDGDVSTVAGAPMNHSNMTRVMEKNGFEAIVNALNPDTAGVMDAAKVNNTTVEEVLSADLGKHHEGDLESSDASPFTYLVTDEDDPYSFRLATKTPKDLSQKYITLSKGGISRTQNGDSEIESLSRVLHEQQLFHNLRKLRFFLCFRLLKSWTKWVTLVSRKKRGAVLRMLQPHLFAQDLFIGYLVRMAISMRESILLLRPLEYHPGEGAVNISEFLAEQAQRRRSVWARYMEDLAQFVASFASEGEKIVMAALLDLPSVISAVNRAPRPAVVQDSSFITSMASSIMMEHSHVYTNYAAAAAAPFRGAGADVGARRRTDVSFSGQGGGSGSIFRAGG